MKNKQKVRWLIVGICALIFYLAFFLMGNHFIQSTQRQQVQALGQDYQDSLLGQTKTTTSKRWQKNYQVEVIDLPATGSTELAKVARNVAKHNLVNTGAPYLKVEYQQQRYLLYLISDQHSKQNEAMLVQPLASIGHDFRSLWLIFSLLYWVLIAAFFWLMWQHQKSVRRKLGLLSHNVLALADQKEPEPVLFTADDPFFTLGNQLKDLSQTSEQQLLAAQLHEQSFKSLINNLPLGVMLLDRDGRVEVTNRALATILNVATREGAMETYVDYVKTYELSRMIEHALRQPQVKRHQRRDIQLVGDEGRFVEADVISLVGDEADLNDMRVLVMLYDLTEIKQNEQMQLDFVANASHELRTPVTVIAGYAETLLAGAQHDPVKAQEFIRTIAEQAQHLEALIHDILLLSRADQDMPIKWQTVHLDQVTQHTLKLLQKPIQALQLKINLDLAQYHGPILSDEVKLEQIIKNLVTNAVRYNRTQGEITIALATTPTTTTIKVRDTGIGLTTEDQTRIFERFYRADHAHSANEEGTGLGLAIVANLVDQLNGQVTVQSQLGVGSTFTVTLPVNHVE
ncbi:sensor histidine kinase [Lapidilactobacillus luobeiensis]|uniref:sensor histidine kinase n=1 Tax=Lapidilactobacillus luobeiensis TaxID=2950371 RepID=UPI0021C3C164|nr:HAMP domain-containing histidine kinase [Lapidilactobacillus luobeiensis]